VSAAWDTAVRAARRERIERLLDADDMRTPPPRIPPWKQRLLGLAEGSYRYNRSEDARVVTETELAMGAATTDPYSLTLDPREFGLTTRADLVGETTAGGYLVETFNLGYSPALQPVTAVCDLVEQLPLPVGAGDVAIPSSTATLPPSYMTTETAGPSDSTMTTGQLSASPHTAIVTTTISRLLWKQSTPFVDAVINLEFRNALRAAVSAAIVAGSGSAGQPHGIIGLSAVGTGSGATLALGGVVLAQETVAAANAILDPRRTAFVAPPATASVMMQRFTSPMVLPLWEGDLNTGMVRGIPAFASNSMPAATVLYGDFSAVTVPIWGGVQMLVDPFSGVSGTNFKAAEISVRLAFTYDVVVRYPQSFYVLTGVS